MDLAELTGKFDIPFHTVSHDELSRTEHEEQVRAIIDGYAPDYVINSGGLIFMALTHQGAQPEAINQQLLRISERLTGIYAHAQAEKRSPARVSDELAKKMLYGE